MLRPRLRVLAIAVFTAVASAVPHDVGSSSTPDPRASRASDRLPAVMLWAWEQPQDLRFIDPARTGVAFLAATLTLDGDRVVVEPRRQPLRVPSGTALVAVGRIELGAAPSLDRSQRLSLAHALAGLARRRGVVGVQVDFDAPVSTRAFYRELLTDLRSQLPRSTALSMTALASWCMGDDWVVGLPVDETVPMLFRMGGDDHAIRAGLAARGRLDCAACRASVGIATDEPLPHARAARTYLFTPGPWTRTTFAQTLAALERRR